MKMEDLWKLINCVSVSQLSSFTFEEGPIKISMEKGIKEAAAVSSPENTVSEMQTMNMSFQEEDTDSKKVVKAPLVGTFYQSPSPDAPAFVNVGDTVKKGQVLGIIEAMKLMNEIECEYEGVVKEILIENQQMVEYGQPMFVIV